MNYSELHAEKLEYIKLAVTKSFDKKKKRVRERERERERERKKEKEGKRKDFQQCLQHAE
jgi:hypothetical protein